MIEKYEFKFKHEIIQLMQNYPDMFDTYDLDSVQEEDLKEYIHNHIRLVFTEDGIIKGFICAAKQKDSLYWKIEWLVVGKEFTGKGIGTKLLQEMELQIKQKGIDRIFLDTSHAKNEVSVNTLAFYEKNGFKKAGELPDYYGKGDSDLIFYKILS